ncbi:Predicted phosphoesterase [Nocardioides scoriae]|uniref:Predicted phosphoesterase n=1 Tax=Nocardioides scoriae TaxID=642780 RepID=A0A1H1LGF2_9ACTN|nr:metallophosphoesterase [Nocardioides scoriae]SDR73115.1 Predicted phosphoesterase [Nocardioides scoriae]
MVHTLVIADEIASNLQERTLREIAPDLVLSAGDLPWDYLEWVVSTVNCPMVFVPGNHDPEVRSARESRSGLWTEGGMFSDGPRPLGVIHGDQQVVEVAGLRIAGLGGCVRYRPGPHQYTQRQFATRAARLARKARRGGPVDVLLTHAPPFGVGDEEDRPHVGIEALHPLIAKLEPTWHLHGHIHPFGMAKPDRVIGDTVIRNVIPWRVLDITPRTAAIVSKPA